MSFLIVEFWAELRRGFKSYIRYPLQVIGEIIALILAFALLDNSGGGESAGRSVGFTALFIAIIGLQAANKVVKDESDVGTLEQLYLACPSLPRVILLRTLADTLRLMPILLGVLAATAPSIGSRIPSRIGPVVLLSLLMNTGMLGIGFILGAITLVFKKIGFLANLASIALLPLALSPGDMPVEGLARAMLEAIPFARALGLFEILLGIGDSSRVWSCLLSSSGALLLVDSAICLAIGLAVFRAAERIARDRGLIGKY